MLSAWSLCPYHGHAHFVNRAFWRDHRLTKKPTVLEYAELTVVHYVGGNIVLFDERAWEAIEKRIAPEYLLDLKRQALALSMALPNKPSEGDVDAHRSILDGLRATIQSIRSLHSMTEGLPTGSESGPELALWALGLAQFYRVTYRTGG